MLLKFGRDEDILDLFENGTIYMNTIQYFKNLEKEGIGDSFETSTQIRNYKNAKLEIKLPNGTTIPLKTNKMHLKESLTGHVGNLYSLYAITPKDIEKKDEQVK